MGSVMLYVDFLPSLKTISRTRLLAKLQPCLPNPVIYHLLPPLLCVTAVLSISVFLAVSVRALFSYHWVALKWIEALLDSPTK